MDVIDVFALIAVGLNWFVYVPILVYLMRRYRQYRDEKIMQFRDPLLLYVTYGFIMIQLTLERCYPLLARVTQWVDHPGWVFWLVWSSTWFWYHCFAIKCYNLYYTQRYHSAIADMAWKRQLDKEYSNWFIDHKDTFGNPVWLLKVASFPYLFGVLAITLAGIYFGEPSLRFDLVTMTFNSIPVMFAFYSFWKAKDLDDVYGIKKEILYQVIFMGSANMISFPFFVCLRTLPALYNVPDMNRIEPLLYVILFAPIYLMPLMCINLAYPVHLHLQAVTTTRLSPQLSNVQLTGARASQIRRAKESPADSMYRMLSVIKHYKAFQGLMRYLVTEFSTENLLFLIDLVMVKHSYQQKCNNLVRICARTELVRAVTIPTLPKHDTKDMQEEKTLIVDYNVIPVKVQSSPSSPSAATTEDYMHGDAESILPSLPSASGLATKEQEDGYVVSFERCPTAREQDRPLMAYVFYPNGRIVLSLAVSRELPTTSISKHEFLFEQMEALFRKYIKEDAVHELNISGPMREALKDLFEDDEWKRMNQTAQGREKEYCLYNLMDSVCVEIVHLMQDSFRRFIHTETYQQLDDTVFETEGLVPSSELFNEKLPVLRNEESYQKLKDLYGEPKSM